ncbi:shikimate dehydrogenase [Mesonia sp. K4-1]|uniref:shikimate dehydrogenase family protein n=1 Tax=Mesonia sp. K4-1 TaxID=2602760 RepID=UPI0011C80DC5|nr:shikimate dehydrogenase [Mesonia sp. K4-1]TXK75039.1 shikimate dehydrogenase [Mesonia sp. K4-1]
MKKFGLIGKNISYSFSRKFFQEKFNQLQIDATYENFDLQHIEELKLVLQKNKGLNGLNVTIPYKESILPFLDELSPEAQQIQAVNTIKISNNQFVGYNTDAFGFMKSLFPILEKQHTHALILGTGGASKAVANALKSMGIEYRFVSRNPQQQDLAYADLDETIIQEHQLIINCTPVGTHPKVKESPALPYQFLESSHLLYDLVYNPPITEFLAKGKIRGCSIYNGKKMLEYQAERAWQIWNE